uniref:Uncharacterized protein n=1 Tax=Trichogramma kaykai TaxID=54128 RepID=A0ABD2VWG2_9HYME
MSSRHDRCFKRNIRRLLEKVDWQDHLDRAKFIREFVYSFSTRASNRRLADVCGVFSAEQIEQLLVDAVNYKWEDRKVDHGYKFVALIARGGYRHKPDLGHDGQLLLRRTTPLHLLFRRSVRDGQGLARQLFKIYDRVDTNYVDIESSTTAGLTHFQVACKFQCTDVVERFLGIGRVDPNSCLVPDSPLRLGLRSKSKRIVEALLDNGANPYLADDKGSTPLHTVSKKKYDVYWAEILLARCGEESKAVWIDARDSFGNTPLILALSRGHRPLVDLLLRAGADPNLANAEGLTPLHFICESPNVDHDDALTKFFEINDGNRRAVQIDVRSRIGNTPLHVAVGCFGGNYRRKTVELLLRRGADPNLSNAKGETCLHIICRRDNVVDDDDEDDDNTLKIFFEINDYFGRKLWIDVRDKKGNTPLHLALLAKRRKVAELLMNRGADLNLANADGSTPLHLLFLGSRPFHADFMERFWEIGDASPRPLKIDARDKRGNTPLHLAMRNFAKVSNAVELMLRRGANPNLANAEGETCLHIICRRDNVVDDDDEDDDNTLKIFFEINDYVGRKLWIDAQDKKGNTPLHLALLAKRRKVAELLMNRGVDLNLANADGSTPLHLLFLGSRPFHADFMERFWEIGDASPRPLKIDARDKRGNTPLHLAMRNFAQVPNAVDLMRRGADLNLTNADGSTPLHLVLQAPGDGNLVTLILFASSFLRRQPLKIELRNKRGDTPLHLALWNRHRIATEFLMCRHADPNIANVDGHTPLHAACWGGLDDHLAEQFFRVYGPRLRVNVRDTKGRTPLHLALNKRHRRRLVELLLRHGADPNSVDHEEGQTPLHILSKYYYSTDRARMFFQINDEKNQEVRVDAKDKLGRTPLQWAVAKLLPSMVDLLLDRGADLANFVFPTEDYFAAGVKPTSGENSHRFKLRLVSGALACVHHLAQRGYELDRAQAWMIMKALNEYGVYEEPLPAKRWYQEDDDDEAFARQTKEIRIGDVTLHELVRLPPVEAEKRVAYQDYFDLWHSKKLSELAEARQAACCRHLSETMAGKFYRGWALYPFWENLIGYRLPLECCEIILGNSTNQELYHVCLAAGA